MRIDKIHMANYKPFDFVGYKGVTVTPTTDIQLLIGDNGSSKTMLLKGFIPSSLKKTTFKRNGFRELKISHDGTKYTLTTDYTNKNQQFSFVQHGAEYDEELNITGLVSLQDELIADKLGFTPLVEQLTTNQIEFSRMRRNERKNHILDINPYDLTYFADLHRKACSKIRECKNNIKMLNSRQAEIENRMADPSIIKMKEKERGKLVDLKSTLDKAIFTIGQYKSQQQSKLSDIPQFDLDLGRVSQTLNSIQNFLIRHADSVKSIEVNLTEVERLKTDISDLESGQLWEISQEIDSYNSQLAELRTNEKVSGSEIEKEIVSLTTEIASLKPDNDSPTLPDTMSVDYFSKIMKEVDLELESFTGFSIRKFLSERKEYLIVNKLSEWSTEISSLAKALESENIRLDETLKELKLSPSNPLGRTDCDNCELFNINQSRISKLEKIKQSIHSEIKTIQTKLSRLTDMRDRLDKFANLHIHPSRKFRNIYQLLNDLGIFSRTWMSVDLPNTLLNKPATLITTLEEIQVNTINSRKSDLLQKELLDKMTILDKFKLTNKTSKEFVEKMLADKQKAYDTLFDRVERYKSRLQTLQSQLRFKTDKLEAESTLKRLQQKLSIGEIRASIDASILYCVEVENWCTSIVQSIDSDLRDLESFLSEQSSLKDRYDNEILPLLKTAEDERHVHEELEMALSPTSGIPQKFLVRSINNYITIANSLIKQVWGYRLELEPLSETDDLTFLIRVRIKEGMVDDIVECSTGQRRMIDLAFNIASLIGQKKYGYPLFLDEIGDGYDTTHMQRLLELLKTLLDNGVISQIVMVNHHAIMFGGFSESDVVCLCDDNIDTPEHVNGSVEFE